MLKVTLLLSCILLFGIIPEQSTMGQTNSDKFLPVCPKKHKCGYIDQHGKIVIKPQFLEARYFAEGLAGVKMHTSTGEKYGFIDSKGAVVIPPQFVDALDFSNGLARVQDEHYKYGFIDKTGTLVIKPAWAIAESFSEGLAKVAIPDDKNNTFSTSGFIDEKGVLVIPIQFFDAKSFSEGLAAACIGEFRSTKCGFIDRTGKWVIEPQFYSADSFSEGLAAIQIGVAKGWGHVDKAGKIVVEPRYSVARVFSEGLASVGIPGDQMTTYGYIDKSGAVIIPFLFDQDSDFSDGLASVMEIGNDDGYIYIDRTGKRINKRSYAVTYPFRHGIGTVITMNRFPRLTYGGKGPFGGLSIVKRCYIDKSGKIIWEEKIDFID